MQDAVALRPQSHALLHTLHQLEGMSTVKKVGALVETFLDTLMHANPEVEALVMGLRDSTRDEKRRLALSQRERMVPTIANKNKNKRADGTDNR